MAARITDPEQLKELLGIPFTPEQTACITAPPAPQVIVAGAGSGKTTVMAARVVWLVGTGQVAPERVLGLTFTNKAAGELTERVRRALAAAGITDPDPGPGPGALPRPRGEGRERARAGGEPGPSGAPSGDEPSGEPQISTYHAFAGQLLKEHGLRIGLEPTARLLADATRFQLAARVLRTAPGPYPALTKSLPALVEDLLALDAELAEHLVEPERLRAHDTALLRELDGARLSNAELRKVPEAARARLELLELVSAYREEKRHRDLLDFGDQIAFSATLARTRPEVGRILREQFEVVLLDEYQDTSVAQRILLSGLFGGGTGHAVTAVGDPCQAIYGWRGASVANLDDFPRHFPDASGRPARRQALSENRRSGGRLLDLANRLAAPLREMHEGVEALRPAPGAERDGSVRCALLPTHSEELAWLADSLAHLVRTGTPPGEIAVLCRTAGDFARIQGALVERDVPVEVVGLSGLLHLPEVADLVAVCEVLQDPTANAALVRLLTGPRWRIGPRDLALLGRRARLLVRSRPDGDAGDDPDRRLAEAVEGTDPAETVSLADALDTFLVPDGAGRSGPSGRPERSDDGLPFSAAARVRFARFAAELRELRRSLADPLMDVLHRVLATTGLEVELSASPHALAARRRETLGNFLDVAASFAALDGEAGLLAFLGFLRTAVQHEKGLDNALPGGDNTVKVLTAHKSKGLEWDVVAVPGLVAKQFPSAQPRDSWTSRAKVVPHALRGDADTLPDVTAWTGEGINAFRAAMKEHQATEELRLGYVTFTRPRSLLLASGHWWGPSQKRPRGPSAFLEELRGHCEAGHGEIDAWAEPPAEGEENPALREAAEEQPWPLPLDPAALALRRRAAERVMAHLDRIAPGERGLPGAADAGPAGFGAPGTEALPHPADAVGVERYAEPGNAAGTGGEATGAEVPDAAAPGAEVPPDLLWGPELWDTEPPQDPDWPPPPEDEDGNDPFIPGSGAPARPAPPDRPEHGTVDGGVADGGAAEPESAASGHGAGRAGAATEHTDGRRPGGVPEHAAAGDGPGPSSRIPGRDGDPAPPHADGAPDSAARDGALGVAEAHGAVPDPARERVGAGEHPREPDTTEPGSGPPHRGGPGAVPAQTRAPGGREHTAETDPDAEPAAGPLVPEEARTVASWDRDLEALAGELRRAREAVREVPVPRTLSTSQLLRLAADPGGFARELARPMPRPPQPAARRGTRFHAWVESRFEELPLPLLGPEELPGGFDDEGAAGQEIADERDLAALKDAFGRTPYARRTPFRVEAPVQITLAGRVIRGRIDAVYRERGPDGDVFEIVDWKTGRSHSADPLQLAVYRLAWAEQTGVPLSSVTAAFLYVRSGEVVRPRNMPDRRALEDILLGRSGSDGNGEGDGDGHDPGTGDRGGAGEDRADSGGGAGTADGGDAGP
ncbi:UvrD-helicase domain-containing protein [Streptomyces sp. WAC 00631]|uniref:UvrD-helicase domain-containing protein n=1 Tax=Streptomyces sp. WAC 00631 TaxID=2203201 RepID=UPI000F7A42B4|nr:UvrD-helicase domain-containing protein [Streptomyces sp. WAC 00631]MCC5035413.1 UvrD-helicase domain-containing protein [Streptomyces sp. WAC 00631]